MQFADLASSLLLYIWHWKCSHCQLWHACDWKAHAPSSTHFDLALPPPMLTQIGTISACCQTLQ